MHKKLLFVIFAFLLVSVVCAAAVLAADNEQKTVRVGAYDNTPKIYRDASGEIKGFWADITNYIAKKENWNLVYVYDTWDEGLVRLQKGEIDLMVDVAKSEERKDVYDFNNETALFSWSMMYVRKGFEIKSFKDLAGKNIAIVKSSVHYTAPLGLKNILNSFAIDANIIDAQSMEDVFKLLDTQQADAGVVNWQFGVSNEDKFKVNPTGIVYNPAELNFAFTKNNNQNEYLISTIDSDLREIKDDKNSVYYQSIKTNFGKFLGEVQVVPKWWYYILIFLGALLVVAVAIFLAIKRYNKILKREISARTKELRSNEEKLRISKQELDKKIESLEKINRLMVGRELDMAKLKKEIESLKGAKDDVKDKNS